MRSSRGSPPGAPTPTRIRIPELNIPATNGMSTETLLFDAVFDEEGTERTEPLVARVAPDPVNVPVFREYDLEGQFQIMRQVALHTSVPVPRVHWLERDAGVLGAPFFVMEKRYGIVPPDLMPYPFGGNWLFDAPRDQQAELQNAHDRGDRRAPRDRSARRRSSRSSISTGPSPARSGATSATGTAYYEWIVADGLRSPLLERALAAIQDQWPEHESDGRVQLG